MKILGIESSSLAASAAILTDDIITAEYTVNFKKTHSQTLLPMIDEIVRMTETNLEEIDAIAISKGPGSFTGLRIGSATAKGIGLALKKPLVSVSTLEAMAYQCFSSDYLICPVMDARRKQVYTALYEWEGEKMSCLLEPIPLAVEDLMEFVNEQKKEVLFTGDGIAAYKDELIRLASKQCHFAPAFMNRQRAASVAALGGMYYKAGYMESAMDHKPEYLRKSQAEREREAKQCP